MTQHTPGPWRIERIPESARLDRLVAGPFLIRSSNNGRVVAELFHVNASDEEPNARLIAAAPEMLEALTRIIYASDQCQGHCGCGHNMEPWQQARALLARIEGKE